MARVVENNKINPAPCVPNGISEDLQTAFFEQNQNWTTQEAINNYILTVLEDGGVTDTYKVAVNATDVTNVTFDYLDAKLNDVVSPAEYDADLHGLVQAEVVGDLTMRLFWRPEDIVGYAGTGDLHLSLSGGNLAWTTFGAGVDNYTVKCTSADTTASYLHDAFQDAVTNGGYVSGADMIVGNETWNDGANEKERLFVDVSAITGHHATNFRILTLDQNVTSWLAVDDVVAEMTAGTYIDISGSTISVDLTEVADYSGAATQFFWQRAGTIEWESITGYDATKTQLLGHVSGTWHLKTIVDWLNLLANYDSLSDQIIGHAASGVTEWKTLTAKVINNVTDADLDLDADSLNLEVDYTPVTIKVWPAASDGTPANYTDEVVVDDCV